MQGLQCKINFVFVGLLQCIAMHHRYIFRRRDEGREGGDSIRVVVLIMLLATTFHILRYCIHIYKSGRYSHKPSSSSSCSSSLSPSSGFFGSSDDITCIWNFTIEFNLIIIGRKKTGHKNSHKHYIFSFNPNEGSSDPTKSGIT